MRIAVLVITKNGIRMGSRIREALPGATIHAPRKLDDGTPGVEWYGEGTPAKLARLFGEYEGLVCVFSLGAVVRLLAPHLADKKTDPAVLVVDDKLTFAISVLSGHLGGANQLARDLAARTGATPVITTAADVNRTIPVDMVGRDRGWVIDDDSHVTRISAHMVNGEPVGVYQDAGDQDWWPGELPGNVTKYDTLDAMAKSDSKAFLVITDRDVPRDIWGNGVVYRPPSLVAGVGLHQNTKSETILAGLKSCMERHGLSLKSVAKLASVRKPVPVSGLIQAGQTLGVPVEYVDREALAAVRTPNPSKVVAKFQGTGSVSEAAAVVSSSGGSLVVEKQKFPPDLTVAVARVDCS